MFEQMQGRLAIAQTERVIGRSPSEKAHRRTSLLILSGYVTAVLAPLLGLIIGIVLIRRDDRARRHGWRVTGIAAVLALFGVAGTVSRSDQQTGSHIAALLIPLIGLITGIVLVRQGGRSRRYGRWVTAVAIVVLVLVAAGGASDSNHQARLGSTPSVRPVIVDPTGLPTDEQAQVREAEQMVRESERR
jgi:drug/metabolite transporter (DMT)-like permease